MGSTLREIVIAKDEFWLQVTFEPSGIQSDVYGLHVDPDACFGLRLNVRNWPQGKAVPLTPGEVIHAFGSIVDQARFMRENFLKGGK